MEREKQKEREKQRFMQEYEERIKDDPDKPKWSESESSASSRSPSPEPSKPWTEEDRQATLVRGTKSLVTEVLMAATNRVLEKACADEIEARKHRGKLHVTTVVKKSAALAALAQFGGSDSEADEDDNSGLPPPPAGVLRRLPTAQKGVEITAKSSERSTGKTENILDVKVNYFSRLH